MLTGIERIDAKLEPVPECGCWLWTGAVAGNGYGSVREPGTGNRVGAHKLVYELVTGRKVRRGLVLLHACDQPLCCNPAHLKPGKHLTNMRDMVRKGRSARRFGADNHRYKHGPGTVAAILALANIHATDTMIGLILGLPRSTVTKLRHKAVAA